MKKQLRFLILKLLAITSVLMSAHWAYSATGYATTGVNFRESPNGRILTGVDEDDSFQILGTSGKWTKVKLPNRRKPGYIYSKYITSQNPHLKPSEGGFCETCGERGNVDDRAKVAKEILRVVSPASGFSNCITNKMFNAARWVHRNKYGGRTKGKGWCQKAVRLSLERAGIWKGGGYGDAKDTVPVMKQMGFKNILKAGMTPRNAPSGTILVYGAKLPGARCKESKGNRYGHIEMKETNSSYLYDGNPQFNIQDAYGAKCRPLIGVMQMGNSCPTCKAATVKACGG